MRAGLTTCRWPASVAVDEVPLAAAGDVRPPLLTLSVLVVCSVASKPRRSAVDLGYRLQGSQTKTSGWKQLLQGSINERRGSFTGLPECQCPSRSCQDSTHVERNPKIQTLLKCTPGAQPQVLSLLLLLMQAKNTMQLPKYTTIPPSYPHINET